MHRLFLAIRPPEQVCDQLLDLMDGVEDMRWQDADQLHCTLRFVGEVERPQVEDLASALTAIRFEPFAVRVQGVGRFDQRRGGTLWAGLAPREPLAALAAKIDRACVAVGLEPERRAYHPHITLARWKAGAASVQPFLERHSSLASEPWHVAHFTLYESHLARAGAHHDAVADYPVR
jgi:2'-5' RNA ligase